MRYGDSDVKELSLSGFLFHNILYLTSFCRAIGHAVVEILLVYNAHHLNGVGRMRSLYNTYDRVIVSDCFSPIFFRN